MFFGLAQVVLFFFLDLLDSPTPSNSECEPQWIPSILTSHYGGKLIPPQYKYKNSFNTLNKDRNMF